MTHPPKEIWLQFYGEDNVDKEPPDPDVDITWAQDEIYNNDVKYIRSDIVDKRIERLEKGIGRVIDKYGADDPLACNELTILLYHPKEEQKS